MSMNRGLKLWTKIYKDSNSVENEYRNKCINSQENLRTFLKKKTNKQNIASDVVLTGKRAPKRNWQISMASFSGTINRSFLDLEIFEIFLMTLDNCTRSLWKDVIMCPT